MGKYFGTDGFRGKANVTLTNDHAYKIGRFLGWYYKKEGKNARIVIGKDTRRSSYMLEFSLVTGISASGGEAFMMHVTTTPSVAFLTRSESFDCGIMISASHNHFSDNGIKLFNGSGEKMGEDLIEKLEDYLCGDLEKLGISVLHDLPLATGAEIGKVYDHFAGRNKYLAFLMGIATKSYKGVRVGLDTANGSAYAIAPSVFEALGAKVFQIGNTPSGTNINEGCGSTHIEALQDLVKKENLDVGFAFDGDADRCLCVSEKGQVVCGDEILFLMAKFLKEKDQLPSGSVSTTVMSNMGLYKALDDLGITYSKTKVGDRFVYEDMVAFDREIGGEPSGHTIFRKYATSGDGVLTAMMVMEVMLTKKTTLSALVQPMVKFPQFLKNVKVFDKTIAKKDEDVKRVVAEAQKTIGENGRVLVRESGTEQLLRIMVEGKDLSVCKSLASQIVQEIERKGHLKQM